MVDVVVTQRAEAELRAIWRVIALDRPAAADRVLLAIDEKIGRLQKFPDLGVPRDDVRPGMRMLVEGNYLVLYEHRETESLIEIVSVIDGRRDLKNWS